MGWLVQLRFVDLRHDQSHCSVLFVLSSSTDARPGTHTQPHTRAHAQCTPCSHRRPPEHTRTTRTPQANAGNLHETNRHYSLEYRKTREEKVSLSKVHCHFVNLSCSIEILRIFPIIMMAIIIIMTTMNVC